jgi:KUP system potassium uptake protein
MREVVDEAITRRVVRVEGVAVYMFKDEGAAPPALVSNLRHNRVLHKTVLLVSVHTADTPRVDDDNRANITDLGNGIELVRFNYGFMEEPDIPTALAALDFGGIDVSDATYFLGREAVTAGKAPGMHPLREELFVLLNRGAASASRFFKLPADQVFEVGSHVEI